MCKTKSFIMIVLMLSVVNAWGTGFLDDFDRPDGELGNGWTTQTDGTIEVTIVGNEVLIEGEQGTDWVRSGLSREVGDETRVSCDFKSDDNFNFHIRIDDMDTAAFLEIYTWGGPLIHANSEDGSWPGWSEITGSDIIAGEYNHLVLEQFGTEFMLTLNDVVVATLTNTALTDISAVLLSSDSAAGTVGSIHIDNVELVEPDTLSGLADVTVVDGAIDSLRYGDTEYVVADGDLMLGTTTRWYVLDGVETLWVEGDPAPEATVSGSSTTKEGDVGSKADNFLFTLDGATNISSIDGIDFQETIFPSLSDTFIIFERGGNDTGTIQAILADGSLGEAVAFAKASDGGPYADTGVDANGQNAYGVVFKTSDPVQGVRITASGHDTLSISAVAPPNIAWVSYHGGDDAPDSAAADVGFTQAPDIGYTDLLKAQGYNVTRVITSGTPDVEFLNTMDLVIISRTASSGHYGGDGATMWNSITSPMINLNGYTLRSSRLGFTDGTDMPDTTGDVTLTVLDPTHPIFAGIDLVDGTMVNPYAQGAVLLPTDGTPSRGISINNNTANPEGTVLAVISDASADTGPAGGMVIAEWPAGAMLTHDGGAGTDALGGPRLVFLTGSREPDGVTGGQAAALYDLYPDGEQMFLNAVDYMLNPPAPAPESKTVVFDFETDAQGWGDLKDGTGVTVVGETYADGGSQSLRATIDEAAHEQQEGGWASPRVFTADDAAGGINTLSFWYRVDSPGFEGGNFTFHWISSTEAWSGGGWYGNGLWGVVIADGQWHQQTADLSILGADAGGWEGVWGDQTAWDFRDDLFYSFEISVSPTDNTNGSNVYIDDIVFSGS